MKKPSSLVRRISLTPDTVEALDQEAAKRGVKGVWLAGWLIVESLRALGYTKVKLTRQTAGRPPKKSKKDKPPGNPAFKKGRKQDDNA